MKKFLLYFFIISSFVSRAQDKVYLMNGDCKIVKVMEIAFNNITVAPLNGSGAVMDNFKESIPTRSVVLIEYKNGRVEIYNEPEKNVIRTSAGTTRKNEQGNPQEFVFNFASINTLAICNADISLFFERLTPSKRIGYGMMGAYNFNKRVTFLNAFIGILHNTKKNYDFGGFLNYYPGRFKRKTTFYLGTLVKYTAFNFSKTTEQTTGTSTIVKYSPAKGGQLAFMFNIGTHTNLKNNFFFKTIAGIGAFPLVGTYKQQYNYLVNPDPNPNNRTFSYSVLPKIYLGFNIGFSF